jgi:uncharacterized protein
MPINAHPDYLNAEKEYNKAEKLEEKIKALEKMLSHVPKHKGAENLRAQLKQRYKKLKEQFSKSKKSGKSKNKKSIKKKGYQIAIIGKTNSGKSTLISLLTNAKPKISEIEFTTKNPIIGIIDIGGVNIQLIEQPAINSRYYSNDITNSADTLIILINNLEDLNDLKKINNIKNKKIILYNLKEKIEPQKLRKLNETLKSKRYNFIITNLKDHQKEEIKELKEKILQNFSKIRIYLKEIGKEKSEKPIITEPNSEINHILKKILKNQNSKIIQIKIWGPSSKFPGQKVGLKHKLKDLDIIEIKTK